MAGEACPARLMITSSPATDSTNSLTSRPRTRNESARRCAPSVSNTFPASPRAAGIELAFPKTVKDRQSTSTRLYNSDPLLYSDDPVALDFRKHLFAAARPANLQIHRPLRP